MKARHLTTLLACAALGVFVSACGSSTDNHFGDNEGIYVKVGQLKYQVEVSRQLNAYDVEDRNYVAGVPRSLASLTPSQQWFGVFVLVQNPSKQPQKAVSEYYVTDTENDVYYPVPIASTNVFAYNPVVIAPGSQLPLPGSPANAGPAGGELLLFKIPYSSDDNRPWWLHIVNSADPKRERAIIVLDV